MAPRSTPTARQQRLGAELRKMREQAGVAVLEAAALLGTDRSSVSNIESARVGVSEDRLRTLACYYRCGDEALIDALVEMARERKGQWWEHYRGTLPPGFLDVSELEHHATTLRTAQITHMPGLLQTEEYARAVFAAVVPPLPPVEVRRRLAHRMERQEILERESPPRYQGIIHESALRTQFGGRKVARGQLDHLLTMTERENVSVLVIPFTAEGFPGSGQAVLYAHGQVPQLDTVQLDTYHGAVFLDSETQLRNYRSLLERTGDLALGAGKSRDLIHAIVRQL